MSKIWIFNCENVALIVISYWLNVSTNKIIIKKWQLKWQLKCETNTNIAIINQPIWPMSFTQMITNNGMKIK